MSFAKEAREEVLNNFSDNECCKLAELSAIIHSAGELSITKNSFNVIIKTDMEKLYDVINDSLKRLYGEYAEITLDEDVNINKTVRYLITIPSNSSRQILLDCGLAKIGADGNFEIIKGIDEHIIESECCALSYIKGIFITSSTAGIKIYNNADRKLSGYHLEFVLKNEELADDFSDLLFKMGINSKKSKRKSLFVLYIKEAEQVSDLLAGIGAFKSVLKLQNEITLRQLRNNINRQNNCFNANVTKTVNASVKQVQAINRIKSTIGFEKLPEPLRELAEVRLKHPDASLEALTQLIKGSTKSGLNHKLRKIMKISEQLNK